MHFQFYFSETMTLICQHILNTENNRSSSTKVVREYLKQLRIVGS